MIENKDLLVAELNIKAVLPVLRILLKEDPKTAEKFKDVNANVVLRAKHDNKFIGANLVFAAGDLTVEPHPAEKGDVMFTFGSVKKMNTFLGGGIALPSIKGFSNTKLLINFITTLLMLKLMMPNVRPKDEHKKYLKVKLALSMVSTALSKLNKSGHKEMQAWTSRQPDRIYQLSVANEDIAVYLRVKAGKTKAGRGFYERKRPFVHMKFASVDSALKILLNDVAFVEAVDEHHITIEGSPEYANNLNDFMMIVQNLIT
jgi:hypothetical protein